MIILIVLSLIISETFSFPGQSDEVLILPGLRIQPSFKHYSGYLNGSDTRLLHYWFVESMANSKIDPLVLWMNGGPGCSSLDGLLTEHGPFRIANGGYLEYNPYSWNNITNIIYLESPACVGFSYSTDGKCDATDDTTSWLNFNALKHFFVKFPQYKGRDFYITGESYGGIYVPTLAERIVLSKEVPYMRLKGMAIGNAYSSAPINDNGNLHFAYNHGLVSDSLWSDIITTCCNNVDPLHCDVTGSKDANCQKKVQYAKSQFNDLNPYNIYSACSSSSSQSSAWLWSHLNVSSNYDRSKIMMGWTGDKDSRVAKLGQQYLLLKAMSSLLGLKDLSSSFPCISDKSVANYLNKDRVRFALHIPTKVAQWTVCSNTISYSTIYTNMDKQYNNLFGVKDFKIWLYNGDIDMMCSYLSEEWYFKTFKRTVTQVRRPWKYTDESNSSQVGGYVKEWDKFILITIRGAGHMVPTDQPISAYHMFDAFINGKEL